MKRRSPTFLKGIICAACGKPAVRTGHQQKFCPRCSDEAHEKRHAKWNKANPESYRQRQTAIAAKGAQLNLAERLSLTNWYYEPKLAWLQRVAIPFSWAGSKNHIWALQREKGHLYLRQESNKIRSDLAMMLKSAINRDQTIKIVQNKVWLDILIQKPNHRGDAANFVDLICDAVKDAIGIDDRWYSIRRLDWQIVKTNPHIFVGIGQEAVESCQICSHCGRILPWEAFQKNRTASSGHTRACKECSASRVRDRSAAARKGHFESLPLSPVSD